MQPTPSKLKNNRIDTREIVIFPVLGVIMFVSKLVMEALPNVHLLAVLTIAYTVAFRVKALIPIYIYALVSGLYYGFGLWWVPHLYLWTILWGVVMLLPKRMPIKVQVPVYMIIAALHGFLYGTLYAPFQAFAFGLSFEGMLSWIVSGIPFDVIHGFSNLAVATLALPIITVLKKGMRKSV